MNVLLETSLLHVGGPQAWVCDIAPALRKRGVGVSVLSVQTVASQDDIAPQRLKAAGIEPRRVILSGGRCSRLRALRRVFDSYRGCDIAHFNTDAYSGLLLPLSKRRGISVRIVHSRTPHWGFVGTGLRNRLQFVLRRWLARRYCTHAFGVTKEALDAVLAGGNENRIRGYVVPSAIASARYRVQLRNKRHARPGGGAVRVVIGFIGRLAASKNPSYAVEVLGALRSIGCDAHLTLVGSGAEEGKVRALAARNQLTDRVSFHQARVDVEEVLGRDIDVLVLPSDYEGTPRVVVEAQACGVPALCSSAVSMDVCIVPELFCRLSLSDGPMAWAKAALRLRKVEVTAERVEGCFARSPFDVENQADSLIGLYEDFLKGTRQCGRCFM